MAQRVERDKAEAEEGDNLVNRQVISGRSPQIPGMGDPVSSGVSNMWSEEGWKRSFSWRKRSLKVDESLLLERMTKPMAERGGKVWTEPGVPPSQAISLIQYDMCGPDDRPTLYTLTRYTWGTLKNGAT